MSIEMTVEEFESFMEDETIDVSISDPIVSQAGGEFDIFHYENLLAGVPVVVHDGMCDVEGTEVSLLVVIKEWLRNYRAETCEGVAPTTAFLNVSVKSNLKPELEMCAVNLLQSLERAFDKEFFDIKSSRKQ